MKRVLLSLAAVVVLGLAGCDSNPSGPAITDDGKGAAGTGSTPGSEEVKAKSNRSNQSVVSPKPAAAD